MEVIALLEAFGLPYVIAPYEAEAQCAVLESLGLVDGVVTDDSDAFLFGAKSVYKNIFSDKKFVEAYLAEDIKRELGLHREELVALAYFLGCDYTDGVTGVGIVNALEIVQVESLSFFKINY
jgi:DNA excision repair protein ERCC-5